MGQASYASHNPRPTPALARAVATAAAFEPTCFPKQLVLPGICEIMQLPAPSCGFIMWLPASACPAAPAPVLLGPALVESAALARHAVPPASSALAAAAAAAVAAAVGAVQPAAAPAAALPGARLPRPPRPPTHCISLHPGCHYYRQQHPLLPLLQELWLGLAAGMKVGGSVDGVSSGGGVCGRPFGRDCILLHAGFPVPVQLSLNACFSKACIKHLRALAGVEKGWSTSTAGVCTHQCPVRALRGAQLQVHRHPPERQARGTEDT
eukprot:1157386-Pelagomonas_calceolata.AAC.5